MTEYCNITGALRDRAGNVLPGRTVSIRYRGGVAGASDGVRLPEIPDVHSDGEGAVAFRVALGSYVANTTDAAGLPISFAFGVSEETGPTALLQDLVDQEGKVTSQIAQEAAQARTEAQATLLVQSVARTGPHVLTMDDAHKMLEVEAAEAVTVTVPPEAAVDFPIGTLVSVMQVGAGGVAIAAGAGVTLRAPFGQSTPAQWAVAVLHKRGADEWVVHI